MERLIDGYLRGVPAPQRKTLQILRERIHRIVPSAEECISYGMPAFRYQGTVIGGFLARADGCSYLPFSGRTLGALGAALAGYRRTKSSLHFDTAQPLPAALLRKLLHARIAEIPARRAKRPRTAK